MTNKQTGAEIVASFAAKPALTSRARQMKLAAQYAVQFGSDRPTAAQAQALVDAAFGAK